MALSEWELWACANKVIEDHGINAAAHASERADEMLNRGDVQGRRVWQLIVERIDALSMRSDQPTH